MDAHLADGVVHGHLHERHAVERHGSLGILHPEHHDHHSRAGADEQRIDVHGQALHEALLHRMRHAGGGGGVRGRAHAGLIGEQAALDAEHDHRTGKATGDGLEVEGRLEDGGKHGRQLANVGDRGPQCNKNVGDGHDGHDDGGDDGDALRAAENDESGEHDEHDAHTDRRAVGGVVGDVVLQRRGHVEGLQPVEAEGEAQDERPGENDAEPALPEALLDVVGRTSPELALLAADLVDLRERGLDEGRSRADKRHEPHPEDGARTARGHGRGDAGDVARAHARGGGHHEGLEG